MRVSAGRGDLVGKIHLLARILGRIVEGDEIIYTLRADRVTLGRILGMSGVEEMVA